VPGGGGARRDGRPELMTGARHPSNGGITPPDGDTMTLQLTTADRGPVRVAHPGILDGAGGGASTCRVRSWTALPHRRAASPDRTRISRRRAGGVS
jgi:hypothetical protein